MKAITLIIALSTSSLVLSQTPAEWQMQHPDGVVISQTIFDKMTAKEIALLGNDVFVFDESQAFEKSNQHSNENSTSGKDEAIKAWLTNHPDIMIVKHSEFLTADDELKAIMDSHHALILAGEVLTLDDISNYPY